MIELCTAIRPRPVAAPPRGLRLYLAGLTLLAAGLWVWLEVAGVGGARPPLPLQTALLGLLCVVAAQFPVLLGPERRANVASSPLFAAAMLLPAGQAMALAFGATLAGNALLAARLPLLKRPVQRQPWWSWLFNALQAALSAGLAGAAYHVIAGDGPAFAPDSVSAGLGLVTAGLLAYAVNTLVVTLAVCPGQGQRNPFGRWLDGRREDWQEEAGLTLVAIVTALIAEEYPWAVLLQAGSIAVVQLSYRQSAQVRQQTRETIQHLAEMVDRRDAYTYQHSRNVSRYAVRIAERLGLPAAQIELIRTAALVHDIGKIAVRDAVLLKPGRLTDQEWAEMKRHPEIGAEMVARLPEYRAGLKLILHHHEAWDGSGYPHGLAGQAIPLGARILALADSYDAMSTDRPYRKALPTEVIVEQLRRGRGRQWDPKLVDLWLEELAELEPAPVAGSLPQLVVRSA